LNQLDENLLSVALGEWQNAWELIQFSVKIHGEKQT
jgi:hypothetical protein